MSNAAPRIQHLPRTLAYLELNLGKWSNVGAGPKRTTQVDGVGFISPLCLRARTSFRAPYRPVKGKPASLEAFVHPSITSPSLVCNALGVNLALCRTLISGFDSTIYLFL